MSNRSPARGQLRRGATGVVAALLPMVAVGITLGGHLHEVDGDAF